MLEFFNFLDILNLIGHASHFANWEHCPHDGAKLTKHWKTISIMFYLQTYIFMFFQRFYGIIWCLWGWREFQGILCFTKYLIAHKLWGAFRSLSSLFRHLKCISIVCFDQFVARFLNIFCLFRHSFLFTFSPFGSSLHIAKCLHRSQTKNLLGEMVFR